MKYTLSTFTVGEENLKTAQRALAELVAALRQHEPGTLYLVFREEDAPAFRCVMAFPDEAAERAHATSPYVVRFARKMQGLCQGNPSFVDLGCFIGTHTQWSLEGAELAAGTPVPAGAAHSRRPRPEGRQGRGGLRPAASR
jgi:quinol monooxygenase YgiN